MVAAAVRDVAVFVCEGLAALRLRVSVPKLQLVASSEKDYEALRAELSAVGVAFTRNAKS